MFALEKGVVLIHARRYLGLISSPPKRPTKADVRSFVEKRVSKLHHKETDLTLT